MHNTRMYRMRLPSKIFFATDVNLECTGGCSLKTSSKLSLKI